MPTLTTTHKSYATTFLRSIRLRDDHFKAIIQNGLRGEISFKYGGDKTSLAQHKELAKIVAGELPGCAIHLPYNGKGPSFNNVDESSLEQLKNTLEAIRLYNPDHLIGHPEFNSLTDSASGVRKYLGQKKGPLDSDFHEPSQEFLDQSVIYWQEFLKASPAYLYLENTYEHSPLPIMRIIELLGDQSGCCLDVGHWFYYAMGKHWDNFSEWLTLIGPRLKHLHLHDNNGEADQHLALGQAEIDLPKMWELLKEGECRPTYTLENHKLDGLLQSLAYLNDNPLF
ncbi:MAG: sugar phosphate isomerase/epimerase [Deltaproteobacteria bacterium]|nr:sugar phosphate isomerase/epimerase [Deltaproteobacteria bacterium]